MGPQQVAPDAADWGKDKGKCNKCSCELMSVSVCVFARTLLVRLLSLLGERFRAAAVIYLPMFGCMNLRILAVVTKLQFKSSLKTFKYLFL